MCTRFGPTNCSKSKGCSRLTRPHRTRSLLLACLPRLWRFLSSKHPPASPPISLMASQPPRHWPSASATRKVSGAPKHASARVFSRHHHQGHALISWALTKPILRHALFPFALGLPQHTDAQLFKTAFENAQASNAALATSSSAPAAAEPSQSAVPQEGSAEKTAEVASTEEPRKSAEDQSSSEVHGDKVRQADEISVLSQLEIGFCGS